MLTTEEIESVSGVAEKNKAVKKLLEEWEIFVNSPVSETYLAIHNKLTLWNKTLKEEETSADLKDADKKFEREMKMVLEADNIHSVLEKLRGRMGEVEKEEVDLKVQSLSKNAKINTQRIAVGR